MRLNQIRGSLHALLAVTALAVLSATGAGAGDRTLRVRLDAPFAIHDHVFPRGGVLVVRNVRSFVPEESVHEVSVNGASLGMLLSRESSKHGIATEDALVFERMGGVLSLVGIARRDEPFRELHRFERADQGSRWNEAARAAPAAATPALATTLPR